MSLSNDSIQLTSNSECADELNKLKDNISRKFISFKSRLLVITTVVIMWSIFLAINSSLFAQTPPTVSIFVPTTNNQAKTITEGEEIAVTIQSTTATTTSLDVTIKIEETTTASSTNILDDSLQNDAKIVTIPAGMSSYTYTINSQQDTSSGNNGEVEISLVASSANPVTYNLVNTAANQKVTYTVNNLEPTINIYETGSTTSRAKTIKEGEEISVDITRSATSTEELEITIMIRETSAGTPAPNILDDNLQNDAEIVTIPANMVTVTYTINSQQDTTSSDNGKVEITLLAPNPAAYSIPTTAANTKVIFTVSHYEPTINIYESGSTTSRAKTIKEGEAMSVDVTRSATSAFALDVTIMVAETSTAINVNILEDSLETSVVVTIPAGELTFTYIIDSRQDSASGAGEVVITLEDEDTYAIPTAGTNQKVTFTITNFAGPRVTIEVKETDVVTGGTTAEFVVRISEAQSSSFTVVVTISGETDYISGSAGDRNVVIPANMLSKTHSEATTNTSSNSFGTITATIKTSSNYFFNSTKNKVSVYINDSNAPDLIVSLTGKRGAIQGQIPGGEAIDLSLGIFQGVLPQNSNVSVRYSISEINNSGSSFLPNGTALTNDTNFTGSDTFQIPTIENGRGVSVITIVIANGPGYTANSFNTAIITMYKKPEVAITAVSNSVNPSNGALF